MPIANLGYVRTKKRSKGLQDIPVQTKVANQRHFVLRGAFTKSRPFSVSINEQYLRRREQTLNATHINHV